MSVLALFAEANMEALSQKSSCACVYLQSTSVSYCRQQSVVSCLRTSAGPLPTSRSLPSIDLHKFAGSSGPMPGNTAARYKSGRNLLKCAAGKQKIITRIWVAELPVCECKALDDDAQRKAMHAAGYQAYPFDVDDYYE